MTGANTLSDEMELGRQLAASERANFVDLDSTRFLSAGIRGHKDLSPDERDLTIPEFAAVLGFIGVLGAYNGVAYIADKAATAASGVLSNIQGDAFNRE